MSGLTPRKEFAGFYQPLCLFRHPKAQLLKQPYNATQSWWHFFIYLFGKTSNAVILCWPHWSCDRVCVWTQTVTSGLAVTQQCCTAWLLRCEPDSVREKIMCLFIKLLHSDAHMNTNTVKMDTNSLMLRILTGFQCFCKHISPHSHSSHLDSVPETVSGKTAERRKTPSLMFHRELTSGVVQLWHGVWPAGNFFFSIWLLPSCWAWSSSQPNRRLS